MRLFVFVKQVEDFLLNFWIDDGVKLICIHKIEVHLLRMLIVYLFGQKHFKLLCFRTLIIENLATIGAALIQTLFINLEPGSIFASLEIVAIFDYPVVVLESEVALKFRKQPIIDSYVGLLRTPYKNDFLKMLEAIFLRSNTLSFGRRIKDLNAKWLFRPNSHEHTCFANIKSLNIC